MTYGVASPGMTLEQLSWHVDDVVKRKLQGAKGVGRVSRIGGVDREIRITLEPDRLNALGITAADVNRQLRATNVDLAGGRGEVGGQEQTIRTLGGARTLEDLRNTKIVLPGGRDVRLGELGELTDVYEEPRAFARLNAETPVVTAAIYRAKGASDYDVKNVVLQKMAELAKENPGVTYTSIDDSVRYTYGNYKSAMTTLIEGALLAVVVVFIFLRDWRATLISCVALPLSIIPTFWAMDAMGFSLNLVSLLAITLVTGILVDDAIVEIENIVRHMRMGKSPYRRRWRRPTRSASPSSPSPSRLSPSSRRSPSWAASPAVFQAVRPHRRGCRALLPARRAPHHPDDGGLPDAAAQACRGEGRLADAGLHPLPRRDAALALDHAAGGLRRVLCLDLVDAAACRPASSRRGCGAHRARGRAAARRDAGDSAAEDGRGREAHPRAPGSVAGAGHRRLVTHGPAEVRKAAVYVQLTPKTERKKTQRQLEAEIAAKVAQVPDLRAWYVNERGERELSVTLVGTNLVNLSKVTAEVEGALRRDPRFRNAAAIAASSGRRSSSRRASRRPRASASPPTRSRSGPRRHDRRRRAGARQVQCRRPADPDPRAGGRGCAQRPALCAEHDDHRRDGHARAAFGGGRHLVRPGFSSIERYNRVRRVVIGTDLVGITTGQGLEIIQALPIMQKLPDGVQLMITGDAEVQGEVFAGFAKAMGLGLLIVFGVLVLLFGSFFHPITIMLSLPLSIGGVILALLITNNPISMPS